MSEEFGVTESGSRGVAKISPVSISSRVPNLPR